MKNPKKILAWLLIVCMVIPMCLIQVSAAEATTVDYKFYDESIRTNSKGISADAEDRNIYVPDPLIMDVLNAKYDTNKAIPLTMHSAKSNGMHIYNGTYTSGAYCLGINDLVAGEWIAIKIKSPGAGTFDGTVRFYRAAATKGSANVYILPGNTADIGAALSADNRYVTGHQMYKGYQNGIHDMTFEKTFTAAANTEYIVVFQMASINDGYDNARFYLDGMSFTEYDPNANKPTVSTTPTTATEPKPTVPAGPIDDSGYKLFHSSLASLDYGTAGRLSLSKSVEAINQLYANGQVNMIPYGWNLTPTIYLHSAAADVDNQFDYNGLYIQKAQVGEWVAFKVKSPGTGLYSIGLDMWYYNDNSSFIGDVFVLPGNTAAAKIGELLTEENNQGSFVVSGETPDKSHATIEMSRGVNLEANQEYIVVVQIRKDLNKEDQNRIDLLLTGLTFGPGSEPLAGGFDPVFGEIVANHPITYAEYYRAFSAVNPANGHDILYLQFKGGTTLVYDVDDKKIVDEITGMTNTPFDMCIGPDGVLYFCGSGNYIHKYDPATGEDKRISFQKFDGTTRNTYGIVYGDDGYIYFCSWGWIGRFDPKTNAVVNLSGTQITSDPNKKSDAQFGGYGGMYYKDGYLYFATYGDLNADLEFTSEFIKYDIANRKVVQAIDILDATHGETKFSYGITYLNRAGDLLIGGFNARPDKRVIIDISGDEMVRLDKLGDFDVDFVNRFTQEVDGKYYFTGYVSEEGSEKCLYEYDVATNTVTRLGDIVLLSTTSCKNAIATIDGLPGACILAPMNNSATGAVDLVIYNIETKDTIVWEGVSGDFGSPGSLQTMTMDPTGRYIYTGAYGTSKFACYDTVTGEVVTRNGHSHQTDGMIWYKDMLWIGNYNLGAITRYDPVEDEIYPLFNLMESVFQNKRMWNFTVGGGKVFCGTVPDTGRFGGVLVWYDIDADLTYVAAGPNPEDVYYADTTTSFVVWRNAVTHQIETFDVTGDGLYDYDLLVDDMGTEDPRDDKYKQRFYGVIENRVIANVHYKDGYLYGTTTKSNGQNISPNYTEGNAQLFAYDVKNMKLLATCDIADYFEGLENPLYNCIDMIDFLAPDPYEDGKFWGLCCDTLFSCSFDLQTNQFVNLKEELSFGKGQQYLQPKSTWSGGSVIFDGDYMYFSTHHYGVQMVNTSDPSINYRISTFQAGRLLRPADGNLYYLSNRDSENYGIKKFDIADKIQPLVAASVQKVIDALPATATMDNESQVLTAYRMYSNLCDMAKNMVDATKLTAAMSALDGGLAGKCDQMIDAIGEVTLDKENAVHAARDYYDSLPESEKAKVTKLDVLDAAEAKLAELKQNAYKNPPKTDTVVVPKKNTTVFVIIGVAAAVVVAAAVAVILIRKKKKA